MCNIWLPKLQLEERCKKQLQTVKPIIFDPYLLPKILRQKWGLVSNDVVLRSYSWTTMAGQHIGVLSGVVQHGPHHQQATIQLAVKSPGASRQPSVMVAKKFYNQFPVTSVTIPIIHSLASVRRMGQQGYSFGVPWVTCDTPLCEQAAPSTSYVSRKDTG